MAYLRRDVPWLFLALLCLAAAAFIALPAFVHEGAVLHTGAYAPLYLYEHSPYGTISVEVHYQDGDSPSAAALDGLARTLSNETGKRVELHTYADVPKAPRIDESSVYAFGTSIIDGHARERMGWVSGDIPIYIIYVNSSGPAPRVDRNNSVAGVSYRADSFIVFQGGVANEAIEKAVLIHETGHLLGLQHDDGNCVMTPVLTQYISQRSKVPPYGFCENHKTELAKMRTSLFYDVRFMMSLGD